MALDLEPIRQLVHWHQYRRSDWHYATPPDGDLTRCGACGDPMEDHPKPFARGRDLSREVVDLIAEVDDLRGEVDHLAFENKRLRTELERCRLSNPTTGLHREAQPQFDSEEHNDGT